jgi:Bacterial Ig domain
MDRTWRERSRLAAAGRTSGATWELGRSERSTSDLDGTLRAINGSGASTCPNGGASQPCPDMGAYEFKPAGSNQAPTCANASQTVSHYAPVTLALQCTDPDSGDTLHYSITHAPTNGTLTNQTADGHVTYNPAGGSVSSDGFTFHAVDSHGAVSNDATFGITIAPDTAPTCNFQAVDVPHDTKVTIALECTDADPGDTLHWRIVRAPKGTLGAIDANGNVDYTPPPGFGGGGAAGEDRFDFEAIDRDGQVSAEQSVDLSVEAAPGTFAFDNGTSGQPGEIPLSRIEVDEVTTTTAVMHAFYYPEGVPLKCQVFLRKRTADGLGPHLTGSVPNGGDAFPCGAGAPHVSRTSNGELEYTATLSPLQPQTRYFLRPVVEFGTRVAGSIDLNFETTAPPAKLLPGNQGVIISVTNPTPGAGAQVGVTPDTGADSQTSADGCITIKKDPNGPGHITILNRPNDPACGGGLFPVKVVAPSASSARHKKKHRRKRKPPRVPIVTGEHLRNLTAGPVTIRLKFTSKTLKRLRAYAHHRKVKIFVYTIIGSTKGQPPLTTATVLTLKLPKH